MTQRKKAKLRRNLQKKRKPLTRSEVMRAVKSKHTKPELKVRRLLKGEKVKFKTHANLPGHPDITIGHSKIAIRVMGCFWHRHSCENGNRIPKSNIEYWTSKIKRNVERDRENKRDLRRLGWRIVDIWECQLRKATWEAALKRRLKVI